MAYNIPTLVENADLFLIPEGRTTGDSTRVAQTVFNGASFIVRVDCLFNRITFRATAQSGAPTARILIYQFPTGGSGTANLIATVSALAIGAAGNFTATPTEGTIFLKKGLCYVLFGRDSGAGSWTARTHTVQPVDLLTANVAATTHPTSFTTAIAATTSPSTFDPIGAAVASALDLSLVVRLTKV